jgi:hypothetical protein
MMTDLHKSAEPRTWVIVLTGLVVVVGAFDAVALWWNGVGIVGWVASRPPLRVAVVFGGLLVIRRPNLTLAESRLSR